MKRHNRQPGVGQLAMSFEKPARPPKIDEAADAGLVAVETLDGDYGTVVDQTGDVKSADDVTGDGLPRSNPHRIALMGPRKTSLEDESPLDTVQTSQKPEVIIGGPCMDLGARATRLTMIMDDFSHASQLGGILASSDPDREKLIEKYGQAKGEQGEINIERRIAEINRNSVENLWNGTLYGLIYGPTRSEGVQNHMFTGFNHEARNNFVGPSGQKNRVELRDKLKQYLGDK